MTAACIRQPRGVGSGWLFGALAAASLAGCDDTPPAPTPPTQAAVTYVLNSRQVKGYQPSAISSIGPSTLADQDHDPSVADRVRREGLSDGALVVYTPPPRSPVVRPFATLSSQALIFSDAGGAASFFAEENKRINVAPVGGTITALAGAPSTNVDQFAAYDASQPPTPGQSGPAQRAFIALVRKGQVVAELYGYAGANSAQPDQFTAYVAAQETLLQTPPQASG